MARKRSALEAGLAQSPQGYGRSKRRREAVDDPDVQVVPEAIQHPLLSLYYPTVLTLRDYLLSRLPTKSCICRRNLKKVDDDAIVQATLDRTLVGVPDQTKPTIDPIRQRDFQTFTQSSERTCITQNGSPQDYLQAEVVDYAIWALFHRENSALHHPTHILCHGYVRAGAQVGQSTGNMSPIRIPGVAVQYSNRHVERLKSAPWPRIRQMLGQSGDAIMQTLLLDCAIFMNTDSGKDELLQVSGIPLCNLAPRPPPAMNMGGQRAVDDQCSLNRVTIVRSRILYARAAFNARGDVRFGLQHIHVLNRFPRSEDDHHTVHIMRYVFPRQFSLHNVFTCKTDPKTTVQPFHDYTVRESEIRKMKDYKAHCRTAWLPRRLRGAPFELVRQIQKRHGQCSYSSLLRHYCPLRDSGFQHGFPGEATPLSAGPKTQISAPRSITSSSVREPRRDNDQPSVTDHATPSADVSAFCRAVMREILPGDAFDMPSSGGSNFDLFLSAVDRFVHMRRFESISLHRIMQNMKITSIPWLCPATTGQGAKMSRSDAQKRTEILAEFVYYLFDSLLMPLIRSNFYATESNVHRNRLFYFRHDVWRKLCEPSLRSLRSANFDELAPCASRNLLSSRALGLSHLRLLPKRTGMRPIVNLRRKTAGKQNERTVLGTSINSRLAPVFSMLNHERSVQPGRLGAALFSVGEVHDRLREFKRRLGSLSGRKFYVVKADVRSCFDSIPQEELMRHVKKLVSSFQYIMSKRAEIKAADPRWSVTGPAPYRRFIMSARPAGQRAGKENVLPIGDFRRSKKLTVETGYQKFHDARRLLELLEAHVTANLVRIGKRCYRQKRGIPQGSVLSSLLCNFFYASFEQGKLAFLGEDSLLLRLIDDFLLITTDRSHASRFLQIMVDGSEEFGIVTNPAKSLVNFDVTINGAKVPQLQGGGGIPYCGMLIDLNTLEISKDRRRDDLNVRHSISVEMNRVPGKVFRRRILNAFKIQMHAMVIDTRLNSLERVMSSLYQIYIETAMKMHCYLKTFPPDRLPHQHQVIEMCVDLLRLAFNLTRGERRTKLVESYECAVTRSQHRWLMAVAFQNVLIKKQARYGRVLTWLKRLEQDSRSKLQGQPDLRRLVKCSETMFAGYRY